MLFLFGGDKIAEAPDYTGIVEDLLHRDFSLPKTKREYKRNVIRRMGKSFLNTFRTDKNFIDYMIKQCNLIPMERLFVYGTLKYNHGNHDLIKQFDKFSEEKTKLEGFDLYSDCSIPFAVVGNGKLEVEVYLIDIPALKRIDRLEGHPYAYERELVKSADGRLGWVYIYRYNNFRFMSKIENGKW